MLIFKEFHEETGAQSPRMMAQSDSRSLSSQILGQLEHVPANKIVGISSPGCAIPQHKGQLTIKCPVYGESSFSSDGLTTRLTAENFLVLNADQAHNGQIGGTNAAAACLMLYFSPDTIEKMLNASLQEPFIHLSSASGDPNFLFIEMSYGHNNTTRSLVEQIWQGLHQNTDASFLQKLAENFLAELIRIHCKEISPAVNSIKSVKPATRLEIFRRTMRGRDFIDANFQQNITLYQISQAAYMSDNYLMRHFRQIIGITPHQYIINKRLDMAKRLLLETDIMINEVVAAVGLEDPSSFIRLFRFKFNCTPRQYRLKKSARLTA